MYIDTHAHLNFRAFDHDFHEAIVRARKANVGAIINVGSNYKTSLKAIEIAKTNENVFAAVGLHPIHARPEGFIPSGVEGSRGDKDEVFSEEKYLKLAKRKQVVAIGETGLDYYYDKSNALLQKEVFLRFLNLSQRVSKPVIIHCREAGEDLLPILMAEKDEIRGVLHCFQEDWSFARVVLDIGFYLSFTGLITFSKNRTTEEVIREAPLERILIETDSPYLTPEPHRGKRNEPAYVIEVAKKIAEIKKIPLEKIEAQTTQNAKELFKLNF